MDSYLALLRQAIATSTRDLTAADLSRHPEGQSNGAWSAAEVLEHLYLTYTGTAKGFERCLRAGKPLASPITWKQRMQIGLVIRLGYFPKGRKAPERAIPKGMATEKVMAEIVSRIDEMGELIARCETLHGPRTRVLDHPILGPLTADQWRKFHWVHGRHHVKQILRLRAAKDSKSARPERLD